LDKKNAKKVIVCMCMHGTSLCTLFQHGAALLNADEISLIHIPTALITIITEFK